ncbi:Para-hydroxybenzoate--polyprenyltransferase, mitochondrial precursor (PHB:polyprenyltransferase) [Entophlyctis luteolus]|nr:Para-hydroxybenzoate--polyprenyltransferase, mitochondrial precursor (PHB:polyprenyltransferase) [Entophlyctis luteolus]
MGSASYSPVPSVPNTLPTYFKYFPPRVIPYLRLARVDAPAGTHLLLLPGTWSIVLASHSQLLLDPSLAGSITLNLAKHIVLFTVGAFVMRGAGCTINDMWDRDFDRKVARTMTRPLASGELSYWDAWVFLATQLSAGLAVLVQLNLASIAIGASSLLLVVIYPLMKRVTYMPQAILGFTFNWGVLVGWSAITGSLDIGVVGPLYASAWCWTMVYDTIYAVQDKQDDVKAGVKSTALLFGTRIKPVLIGFGACSISLLALAGYMNGQGLLFYLISVGGGALHYLWTLRGLDASDSQGAGRRFKAAVWYGWIVFVGALADFVWDSFVLEYAST